MPGFAMLLGGLALIPYVWFGFGAVGHIPETAERMLVALIDYAALVLSFAGGVHWGLAIAPEAARPTLRLLAGAVPMITAWIGLLLAQLVAPSVALAVLVAGYLGTVMAEHQAARRLFLPSRYMWLRWIVSIVAVFMMLFVALMRGLGQTIVF